LDFAVVNQSSDPDVRDGLAWAVRACNRQMAEDFLPLFAPMLDRMGQGREHRPAAAYAKLDGVDPSEFDPCFVLDKVPSGELGSHNDFLGVVSSRALAQGAATSVTLSHEYLEWRMDRSCALWVRQPAGQALAAEPCDAVETSSYFADVELLGISKRVELSNFCLPAWFTWDSPGPWDFVSLGKAEVDWILRGPGTVAPGCHAVSMSSGGDVSVGYGRDTAAREMAAHAERLAQSLSRTSRRFRTAPVFVS
jgi:hypothetical protein